MGRVKELIVQLDNRLTVFGPSMDMREGGSGATLRAFRPHCATCGGPYVFGEVPCETGEQRTKCLSRSLKQQMDLKNGHEG